MWLWPSLDPLLHGPLLRAVHNMATFFVFYFNIFLSTNDFFRCTIQWLLAYSQNCATTTTINFRTLIIIKEIHYAANLPSSPTRNAQICAITNLFSDSIDLCILDISYKHSHKITWPFVTGFYYLA